MKRPWLWTLVIIGLVLLTAYQASQMRQQRSQLAAYGDKVDNAFRYTASHMDLDSFPSALDAFLAAPNPESANRLKAAAADYGDMLQQLNDLRESGPPTLPGIISAPYRYTPSTQAQSDMELRIFSAGLWPELSDLTGRVQQNGWQVRPEDRPFLADAARLIRHLNEKLLAVKTALTQQTYLPNILEHAKMQAGQIGPDLNDLAGLIKQHQATLPKAGD